MLGRVLGSLDHDAAHRAGDRAQLAADTLLQAVGVAVQDMPAARPRGNRFLPLRVLDRHDRPGVVLEGGGHGLEQVVGSEHYVTQGHGMTPYLWAATTTTAVAIIMIRDSGRSDFQPSAISRS